MAYAIKKNTLKNGEVVYYIFEVSRIPGEKNKQQQTLIEKHKASELKREGFDPEKEMQSRLEKYRSDALAMKKAHEPKFIEIDLTRTLRSSHIKLFGSAVYAAIYHQLKLDDFVEKNTSTDTNNKESKNKINLIIQHLIFANLLFPDNKEPFEELKSNFFRSESYNQDDVQETLTWLIEHREALLEHLRLQIEQQYGTTETFFCHDLCNGKRVRVFLDPHGFPIDYEVLQKDGTLLEATTHDFADKKIIYVTDAGYGDDDIKRILLEENGYIFQDDIFATKEKLLSNKNWSNVVTKGKTIISKSKEIVVYDDEHHIKERQAFFWSRDKKREVRADRDAFLADFIHSDVYEIDWDAVKKDEPYDGYTFVRSNVMGCTAPDADQPSDKASFDSGLLTLNETVPTMSLNDALTHIEKSKEAFKAIKDITDEESKRTQAIISFLAYLIETMLERKLGNKYSTEAIQEILSSFRAVALQHTGYYEVIEYDESIALIFNPYGLTWNERYWDDASLRKLFGEKETTTE